jgi:hypothetical protein
MDSAPNLGRHAIRPDRTADALSQNDGHLQIVPFPGIDDLHRVRTGSRDAVVCVGEEVTERLVRNHARQCGLLHDGLEERHAKVEMTKPVLEHAGGDQAVCGVLDLGIRRLHSEVHQG